MKPVGVCSALRESQSEGLVCPKVSDTCWLNDGAKAALFVQLMVSVWLLWVHVHTAVGLPWWCFRQENRAELSWGERP